MTYNYNKVTLNLYFQVTNCYLVDFYCEIFFYKYQDRKVIFLNKIIIVFMNSYIVLTRYEIKHFAGVENIIDTLLLLVYNILLHCKKNCGF